MKKKSCDLDLNTRPLNPKSAMLAPRPQIREKGILDVHYLLTEKL